MNGVANGVAEGVADGVADFSLRKHDERRLKPATPIRNVTLYKSDNVGCVKLFEGD